MRKAHFAVMETKRVIEAILFVAGREVSVDELMRATGIAAPGFVKQVVAQLAKEYEERGSAIEIRALEGAYLMTVKPEFVPKVQGFFRESELSRIALRVLALVVKNEGILKSDVVKVLGSSAYQGVKELVEKRFIKEVKAGRSKRLFLTKKFKAYFGESGSTR